MAYCYHGAIGSVVKFLEGGCLISARGVICPSPVLGNVEVPSSIFRAKACRNGLQNKTKIHTVYLKENISFTWRNTKWGFLFRVPVDGSVWCEAATRNIDNHSKNDRHIQIKW